MADAALIVHWDPAAALRGGKAQKKMYTRWSHLAKAYGFNKVCLIDVESLQPEFGDQEIELQVVDTLEEALALYPTFEPVYVRQGGVKLEAYQHPGQAAYIFGPDYGADLPKADVSIPTVIPVYADQACAMVLYGRSLKWPSP